MASRILLLFVLLCSLAFNAEAQSKKAFPMLLVFADGDSLQCKVLNDIKSDTLIVRTPTGVDEKFARIEIVRILPVADLPRRRVLRLPVGQGDIQLTAGTASFEEHTLVPNTFTKGDARSSAVRLRSTLRPSRYITIGASIAYARNLYTAVHTTNQAVNKETYNVSENFVFPTMSLGFAIPFGWGEVKQKGYFSVGIYGGAAFMQYAGAMASSKGLDSLTIARHDLSASGGFYINVKAPITDWISVVIDITDQSYAYLGTGSGNIITTGVGVGVSF